MKKKSEPTINELKKQVESLKKKKEEKLLYAKTYKEREQLLSEINKLEAIKKSPSKLKSFTKTFGRGLGITGKTLWRGIKTASRNLDRNSPQYRELSRQVARDIQTPKMKKTKKKTTKKKPKKIMKSSKPTFPAWGLP